MSEQKSLSNSKPASKRRRTKAVDINGEAFKKLRVMVLCHEDLVPPDSIDDLTPKELAPFKTEWDVISTLKKIGHEVNGVERIKTIRGVGYIYASDQESP